MSRPENSEREALVEHERSKERVGQKIGRAIETWFDRTLHGPPYNLSIVFPLSHLENWVDRTCGPVAGGSVSRIMRDMRQKGRISYELVSRHKSLYRALPLDTTTTENTK